MIQLYTGEGKGKTTAAIGQAVRAAGRGFKVLIVQFLKGRDSGELHSLAQLPKVTVLRLSRDYGFVKYMSAESLALVHQEHDALLAEAAEALQTGACEVLILDEIAAAARHELVNLPKLLALLDAKPVTAEIVMTGRDAPDTLIERADYITEMRKIKHPFDQGIPARKGIEW